MKVSTKHPKPKAPAKPEIHPRTLTALEIMGEVPEQELESEDVEELAKLGDHFEKGDLNFETELEYEGYHSIEESDNNTYGSRSAEQLFDDRKELNFDDRQDPVDLGEESLINPQNFER